MTTDDSGRRVSHDLLMKATEILSEARNVERDAGHNGMAMVLNDLVISLFRLVMDDEVDRLADAAFKSRYPVAGGQ